MQEELGKYIADLLYRHDRLNIPGLGSFELSHAPALVDQVQGQVSAPTKAVRFNENLVMDDGILVAYLQRQNDWTLMTAQNWLRTRVDGIKKSLSQKEIVELPGVGRFFRNFEQQLQFVAESENFNIETFGLQAVKGQLIQRSREEKIPAAKPITNFAPNPPPVQSSPSVGARANQVVGGIAKWFQGNLIWLLGLSLVVITLATYLLFFRPGPEVPDPIADVPQERLNASPSKSTPLTPEDTPVEDNTADTKDIPAAAPPEEKAADLDTEAPTVAQEEHTAVIAVGLFGNPDNVQKLMQRLSEDGYAPISRKEGKNTRIGVSVRFTNEAELQQLLRDIRRDYAKNAFLLSRDGETLR